MVTSFSGAARPDDASAGDTHQQFVIFTLEGQEYGIDIMAVREIRGWQPTTPISNAPEYVRGVIDLRGEIVPNIDLRAKFGMGDTEPTDGHVVVLVAVGERIVGILADSVSDIMTIRRDQVCAVPDGTQREGRKWLSGLASNDDRMMSILDLDALFGDQDMSISGEDV